MTFTWLSRTASNTQQVAAVQANAAGANIDASPGSITLALVQAVTGVALWIQGLVVGLIALTRLATSKGPDVDSWLADFSLARIGASAAAGSATFSRNSPASPATILIGALISTGPGGQQFQVTLNTGNPLYSAGAGGYVIPSGQASAVLPIAAVTGGTAGNVQPNTITSFYTTIPYVDGVTNAAALTGGTAGQTDAQARAIFPAYLLSLAKATIAAVDYAVQSTPGVVSFSLTVNYDPNGAWDPGSFYVAIDDGTGTLSPTSALVQTTLTNVGAVAGTSIRYGVLAAASLPASVSGVLSTASGYNHAAVCAAADTALAAYIVTLAVGGSLSYGRLFQVIFDSSPGINDVTGLTLNGGIADLICTPQQVIRPGTIALS